MYGYYTNKAFRVLFTALLSLMLFFAGMTCMGFDDVFADCMDPDANVPPEVDRCQSHPEELVTLDMIPENPDRKELGESIDNGLKLNDIGLPSAEKTMPTVVIVIGFGGNSATRMPYNSNIDWEGAVFSGRGYNGKSVRDFYRDMSYGQFTFDPVEETSEYNVDGNTNQYDRVNDGIVHVSIDNEHQDWSAWDNADRTKAMGNAFAAAVKAASKYVDFPKYDTNHDGVLETREFATVFIVAGYDSGIGDSNKKNSPSKYMRSHQWKISSTKASAPRVGSILRSVTVNHYVAISEMIEQNADGDSIVMMGRRSSLAHELGHHLGLPDLYDTTDKPQEERNWRRFKVQYVSLMAQGSWGVDVAGLNGKHSYIPYSLDPWSKIQLGWNTSYTVSSTGLCTVTGQDYNTLTPNRFIRINVDGQSREYYLIEARYLDKWDAGMDFRYPNMYTKDSKGGLIIWHIDQQVLNVCLNFTTGEYKGVNDTEHRPAIMPHYMERENNQYTVTSSGIASSVGVYINTPFMDKTYWDKYYKPTLGLEMPLSSYDGLSISSKPDTRIAYGATIEPIDDAQRVMNFRYITADHVHSFEDPVESDYSEDLCKNGGTYNETRTCKLCGQKKTTVMTADAGHRLDYHANKEAECERNGSKAFYECRVCGKMFADESCEHRYTEEDIVIPKLGHDWQFDYVYEEPTYESNGLDHESCTRCSAGRLVPTPALDRAGKMGKDGTPLGEGAAIEAADPFLTSYISEKDPAGSVFRKVALRSTKQTNTSVTLTWTKPASAYKTLIYGSKCGNSQTLQMIKEVVGGSSAKITGLKKSTYYKFVAVALNEKDDIVSTSRQIHVATKGSKKKSNNTSVSITKKVKKKAAALKKGKSLALKATAKKAKNCKVVKHTALRYESTAPNIAKVSTKGTVKGVSKGTCYVYAYAQNGVYKKIKVKVK